ncbi:MAG TPA: hypothetical protein VIJ96_09460 [Acidothermaceae bacterium]
MPAAPAVRAGWRRALTADTDSHLLRGVARQATEAAAALVPRAELHARDHHVTTT